MATEGARELLRQLCEDIRLLRSQAGGPSLRALGVQLRLGKSQVGAILNGRITQPPDWDVVRGLVDGCRRHAQNRSRLAALSVPTGIEEFWRPRYAALDHAFRNSPRTSARPPAAGSGGSGRASRAAGGPAPHHLPAAIRPFVGRAAQLAGLTALTELAAGTGTVVISAIDGTPGVGKTALAVHWAHRIADRFPDGQLYVNLRGFDPARDALEPAEAVRGLLDALGVPPRRIPAGLDAQAALYRSELAGRRVLILLDNARDSAQVRPLLPGAPGCLVLVTSRNQLSGLVTAEAAHPVTLDLLTAAEARELLARRLGRDRVAAEPDAVDQIVAGCARLPLALAIVAARAAARPYLPLRTLADQLRDARLDALASVDDPTADARAVFSWSYRLLDPAAARLFRLLSRHPGPEITAPAAASLAAQPLPQTRALLAEFGRASLLAEPVPGRYVLHDLLRAYAAEQSRGHDGPAERRAATGRLLDHHLHTAAAADRLSYPARDPVTLARPAPGVCPEPFADGQQALAWLRAEQDVLLAAIDLAAGTGSDAHTWQLAWTVFTFLDRRGHWDHCLATQRLSLAAARRLADLPAQARAYLLLARAYARLGRHDDAHTVLQHAQNLYRQTGDRAGQAQTHHYLALVRELEGDYAAALDHDRRAVELYRAAGHGLGEAVARNGVGWYQALLGDHEQAVASCRQALALYLDHGDRYGQAITWDSLGYAHHHLGRHAEALDCYRHALELFQASGDRQREALILIHLGDTQHATGDLDAARRAWQHALATLEDLRDPDADRIRTKLAALGADVERAPA
ncbi:MAG TPA: tetratricopeptide repeat protein [Mycobacteriales bacterium]|nr:tetratricopeptide repeat protein [Mycobacteriales bacterium]